MQMLKLLRNKKGMSTLIPVIGVGALITASFIAIQQFFIYRTQGFTRDVQSNRLVNIMETLGKNVVLEAFEQSNRNAYAIFAACQALGADCNACAPPAPWGPGPIGPGEMHRRMGPTGRMGCYPNIGVNNGVRGRFCDLTNNTEAKPFGIPTLLNEE